MQVDNRRRALGGSRHPRTVDLWGCRARGPADRSTQIKSRRRSIRFPGSQRPDSSWEPL